MCPTGAIAVGATAPAVRGRGLGAGEGSGEARARFAWEADTLPAELLPLGSQLNLMRERPTPQLLPAGQCRDDRQGGAGRSWHEATADPEDNRDYEVRRE